MPLLIAQPRMAVCAEAVPLSPLSPLTGAACQEGVSGRAWGDALQVFPPIGESWKKKSVFVFISLCLKRKKKKRKRTPELIICKSWMRNLEATGPCIFKSS